MLRIRNKGLEILHTKMDLCIRGIGLREGNMEMEHIILKVDCVEKENG